MSEIIKQFFDENLYLESYPDVAAGAINPWEHFRRYGISEKRQFSRLVPPAQVEQALGTYTAETISRYLREYLSRDDEDGDEKLDYAIKYGAGHANCSVCAEISKRALPEKLEKIIEQYKPLDVIAFCCENTNALVLELDNYISVADYLQMYPDVSEANVNAYFHYYIAGRKEGRRRRLSVPSGIAKEFHRQISATTHDQRRSSSAGDQKLRIALGDVSSDSIYLYLSHDNPLENLGGIQQVVAKEFDLIIENDASYIHIFPEFNKASFDDDGDADISAGVIVNGEFCGYMQASMVFHVLRNHGAVFEELRIHHLFGQNKHTLDLLSTIKVKKRSYILHDHSFLCDGYHLLRNNLTYCGAPTGDKYSCNFCIHGKSRISRSSLLPRLKHEGYEITAPSEQVISVSKRQNDNIPIKFIPHWTFSENKPSPVSKLKKVNVAYCGFDAFHKGYDVFLQAVRQDKSETISYFFLGASRPIDLPKHVVYVQVRSPHLDAFAFRVELIRRDIHMVIMPSRCPESFGFIAHEAKAAGCTVVVTEHPPQPVASTPLGGMVITTPLDKMSSKVIQEAAELIRGGFSRKTLSIKFQTSLTIKK